MSISIHIRWAGGLEWNIGTQRTGNGNGNRTACADLTPAGEKGGQVQVMRLRMAAVSSFVKYICAWTYWCACVCTMYM